ncbi:MAG: hypothetical protein P8Z37_06220 [Acidobacteriota bacterium]
MKSYKVIHVAAFFSLSIFVLCTWSSCSRESKSRIQTLVPNLYLSLSESPDQCPDRFVDPETEGPYYKKGSPERTNFIEEGIVGDRIILSGYVFDRNCNPIAGAWLDFWQTDGQGNYDNSGYKLRGHQFTGIDGRYQLRTVMPRPYPGRTSHIHVKVARKVGEEIVTTQLYFPDRRQNERDPIFSESMVIKLEKQEDGSYRGYFNFRLNRSGRE